MSAENIEAIGRLYRAMNDRDPEAITGLVHPAAEWVPDARVGEGPVRGLDNIVGFFSDRAEMFESVATVTERLVDADDKVLAFVRVTGVGRASGAEFDIRIAHLWDAPRRIGRARRGLRRPRPGLGGRGTGRASGLSAGRVPVRLRPESGGPERFGPVGEAVDAEDQAVPEGVEVGKLELSSMPSRPRNTHRSTARTRSSGASISSRCSTLIVSQGSVALRNHAIRPSRPR